jgi:hypothetical protein
VILFTTFVLTIWIAKGKFFGWKKTFIQGIIYVSSLGYLFTYAFFLYIQVKMGDSSTINPLNIMSRQGFLENLRWFSNLSFPLTPLLIVALFVLVIMIVRGWQRIFLVTWMALSIILFLNPLVAPILVKTLIPADIYWRLFYILPFPLMASIIAATLLVNHRVVKDISYSILALSMIIFLLVSQHQGIFSASIIKIADQDLSAAREISSIAPPGVMLAPPSLYGLIPMIDGIHPQIRSREDGNYYYLSGNQSAINERQNASRFTAGETQYIEDFESLLEKNVVKTIVLSKSLFKDENKAKINTILYRHQYLHRKSIGGYLIVWK